MRIAPRPPRVRDPSPNRNGSFQPDWAPYVRGGSGDFKAPRRPTRGVPAHHRGRKRSNFLAYALKHLVLEICGAPTEPLTDRPSAPPDLFSSRLSEVVYTVSPMKVGVMGGLFKDFGNVMTKKLIGWTDMALFGIAPTVGIYQYAVNYKENEKMSHRY